MVESTHPGFIAVSHRLGKGVEGGEWNHDKQVRKMEYSEAAQTEHQLGGAGARWIVRPAAGTDHSSWHWPLIPALTTHPGTVRSAGTVRSSWH